MDMGNLPMATLNLPTVMRNLPMVMRNLPMVMRNPHMDMKSLKSHLMIIIFFEFYSENGKSLLNFKFYFNFTVKCFI